MKRPVYLVTVPGAPPVRKHAWNSALRAMGDSVRSILSPGQSAEITTRETVPLDQWTTAAGSFTWSLSDGREITATIALESTP